MFSPRVARNGEAASRLVLGLIVASLLCLRTMPVLASEDCDTDKPAICHKPGTAAEQTLCVSPQAVPVHQSHGDSVGPCCAHSPFEIGVSLDPACSPLVASVCNADVLCCSAEFSWDDICVCVADCISSQSCSFTICFP